METVIIIVVIVVLAFAILKGAQDKKSNFDFTDENTPSYNYKPLPVQQEAEKEKNSDKLQNEPFFKGEGGRWNMAIKGLYYRSPSDIEAARHLFYGNVVHLQKEFDNEIDPDAVAVYTDYGNHIGYVPKEYAKGISSLMDKGLNLKCKITKNTHQDIPFLYMDVFYKSKEKEARDAMLEKELINKFQRLGIVETSKLRWNGIHENRPRNYEQTEDISAELTEYGFSIKETLTTKTGKKRTIEYYYRDNIGENNYAIGERLERAQDIEGAILKYEENLDIEETVANSAIRLSILYKKVKRHKDIIPMLKKSLAIVEKQADEVSINKVTDKLEQYTKNESFMKKYGDNVTAEP